MSNQIRLKPLIEAIIFAGGRGNRLRPITDKTPKSLLAVNGSPMILYALAAIAQCGPKKVNLAINYKSSGLISLFRAHWCVARFEFIIKGF